MSSPPFDATLELAPRPSLRALTLLFWLHSGLLALALVALQPGTVMVFVAGGVALSWFATRRHPLFGFGKRALVRLTWHANGRWSLRDATGVTHDGARLEGNSIVIDAVIILDFRLGDGSRRARAFLGDELEPEQLRRLRARLNGERGRHEKTG